MSDSRKPQAGKQAPELLDENQLDSAVGGSTKTSTAGTGKSRGNDHEVEYDLVAAR